MAEAGAVPAGYEALREGAAWVDLSRRGKIKMLGEDRARLLHAMTTNQIEELTPGNGCYAYFLSAQGRILADVNVLCRPDHLLLDTEPETCDKIYQHLDKFIIADDVTLEDQRESTATLAVEGPQAEQVLRRLGATVPAAAYQNEAWEDALIARISYTGAEGFWLIVKAAGQADWQRRLAVAGAQPAGLEALEIVRLEHGKPRYGADLSERFLAQEANQPHALNFQKGCYLGQEIVERVRSRGQIHRMLVPLEMAAATPPEAGTKLQENGANIAEITSAVYSPALGKVVALAYVRTDRATPGTELRMGDVEVRVRQAEHGVGK